MYQEACKFNTQKKFYHLNIQFKEKFHKVKKILYHLIKK